MSFLEILEKGAKKAHSSISAIVKILLVVSVIYSVYFHLWRILFADLYLLLMLFTPYFLRKKYNLNIPREIEAIVLIFTIITFFLGEVRGLLIQSFFGLLLGFIGFTTMVILYARTGLQKNYLLIGLFSLSFSLAIGTILEISKYILKSIFKYPITITDYEYAMTGLIIIILGSLISIIVGELYIKEHKILFVNFLVRKFKKINPNFFIKSINSEKEVLNLLKEGESETLEFKSTLKTNLHTKKDDPKIQHAALKTITAFLNTEGGTLLIGVNDEKKIIGIEKDNFKNADKMALHLTNLIKEKIGKNFTRYVSIKPIKIGSKKIMRVQCKKSRKPAFLKWEGKEEFFVRVGPATNQLNGKDLIEFTKENFH